MPIDQNFTSDHGGPGVSSCRGIHRRKSKSSSAYSSNAIVTLHADPSVCETKKFQKSNHKEYGSNSGHDKAKVRNEKAKNAGAKLGSFLRASLSLKRYKSQRHISDSELTENSQLVDSLGNMSRTGNIFPMRHSGRFCEIDFEGFDGSAHSFTSRHSERSFYSADYEEDLLAKSCGNSCGPNGMSREPSEGNSNRSQSAAREKLLHESMRAIERKQNQARVCSEYKRNTAAAKALSSANSPTITVMPASSNSGNGTEPFFCSSPVEASKLALSSHSFSASFSSVMTNSPVAISSSEDINLTATTRSNSMGSRFIESESSNIDSFSDKVITTTCRDNSDSSLSIFSSDSPKPRIFLSVNSPVSSRKENIRPKSPSLRVSSPTIVDVRNHIKQPNDDILPWHSAILKHDWNAVESLLRSYDHNKYRNKSEKTLNKAGKTLRILKYLPNIGKRQQHKPDENIETVSPLLQIDSRGRTPLHLACKEHMPTKLLQRLYFVERNACRVQDEDWRYPLHVAVIHTLNKHLLDRFIRSNPDSLGTPDKLKCTPIQYAVLKAEYRRNKNILTDWSFPTTKEEATWQEEQNDAWGNVSFILDTMLSRNKCLSAIHEAKVLAESMSFYAPPTVIYKMLTLDGGNLLLDKEMSKYLVGLVFYLNYPIFVIKKVLKIVSQGLPKSFILDTIQQSLVRHFKEGCTRKDSEHVDRNCYSVFGKELLQCYRRRQMGEGKRLSKACQHWWEKLRFLIAYSSCRFKDDTDDVMLHAALTNPKTPPLLIEFLCRLLPSARYEIDPATKALPLHLACIFWFPTGDNVQNMIEYVRVSKLLMAGDIFMVRRRFKNRLPLHYAVALRKSLPIIREILVLDKKSVIVPDPKSRLLPFQLAAVPRRPRGKGNEIDTGSARSQAQQLDSIYELLRPKPSIIAATLGQSSNEMSTLTFHALSWCYDHTNCGWILNESRKDLIRQAITRGKILDPMKRWWTKLKMLIWRASNDLDQGGNLFCNTPQTREYLLHFVLWNAKDIPPVVIELIVELYPSTVFAKQLGTNVYPIHIAAQSSSYRPFPFESTISMSSALEMLTLLDEDGLKIPSNNGQLPIHLAIASGKTWGEIRCMIKAAPETISMKDPCTGFYPYQLASCQQYYSITKPFMDIGLRMDASPRENAEILRFCNKKNKREKLSTIYELLRAKPSVLEE